MTFSLPLLLLVSAGYLFLLFFVAFITQRGWVPARIIHSRIVYVFSLGVFVSAWAIYGSVGLAHDYGYHFLAYYLGISSAFLLAPLVLRPILRLVKTYQLSSLTDLLAYRYPGRGVGVLVTLIMLMGVVPLLALQIQAVADSVHLLNQESSRNQFALVFVAFITLFAVLFGATHISAREKHHGLVMAIAFESLIKLICFIIIGVYILTHVFSGFDGLSEWLSTHPSKNTLRLPVDAGSWYGLIITFFMSAIAMPHMYHMTFTENLSPRSLMAANWGFPIYILIMAFIIPLILWGATKLHVSTDPEYFTLGLGLAAQSKTLTLLAFLAGLSAASGVMIVLALSMAMMVLNHLVLPFYQPSGKDAFFPWLLRSRRMLIVFILFCGYLCYLLLNGRHNLSELGLLASVAFLQCAPGLVGVILWPRATRQGFIAGTSIGFFIWFVGILIPMLANLEHMHFGDFVVHYTPTLDQGQKVGVIATLANSLVFILISLLTQQSPAEQQAAANCALDKLRGPNRYTPIPNSVADFIHSLSGSLGKNTTEYEVQLALKDLDMDFSETRPYALKRLRDQLESNLSSQLGPSLAREMIHESLPYESTQTPASDNIHFIENRLEEQHHTLTGLAAELDNLRRFHRQTLHDLPIGVCSLSGDGEILSWNLAMEQLTDVQTDQIVGSKIKSLPLPWKNLFEHLMQGDHAHLFQREIKIRSQAHWINLHKAMISTKTALDNELSNFTGLVIVVEDVTETKMLEAKLAHSARLASIGQLAAGVAHEIGNPITGIACLAQDIQADPTDPQTKEMAQHIIEQTKRISRIVQSLVSFSHAHQHHPQPLEPVDISQCLQEALNLIMLSPEAKELHLINHCPSNLHVAGDAQRLVQVFINLLSNAMDASVPGNSIEIQGYSLDDKIIIRILDEGYGIPNELLGHIFEPFVTTKDPGKGTGLGLSLVYSIVADHAGYIELMNRLDAKMGIQVTLTLPKCYV